MRYCPYVPCRSLPCPCYTAKTFEPITCTSFSNRCTAFKCEISTAHDVVPTASWYQVKLIRALLTQTNKPLGQVRHYRHDQIYTKVHTNMQVFLNCKARPCYLSNHNMFLVQHCVHHRQHLIQVTRLLRPFS